MSDSGDTPRLNANFGGIVPAVKADRDHLIGTEVVIDTDCLSILGMVSGCATPNLAMLRWIAYIKSLNPEIRHISEKDKGMADMLSRARFDDEGGMVSEDEEVGVDFFEAAHLTIERGSTLMLNEFDESEYDGEWLRIGRFLRTMTPAIAWTRQEAYVEYGHLMAVFTLSICGRAILVICWNSSCPSLGV
jgi:hypothetical protein